MRQLDALLSALSFLTRVPVPAHVHLLPAAERARGMRYFALVGALVGLCTASVLWASLQLWPAWIAVPLALAVEALLTGAFHEDALADCFDAFGGGYTRARVLEILKDSRLGTYGVLALVLGVAVRAAALAALGTDFLRLALVCAAAGALGRWSGTLLLWSLPALERPDSLAKDLGAAHAADVLWGALFALAALAGFAWLEPGRCLAALLSSALIALYLRQYFHKHLGGTTGDCLGALTWCVQLCVLLAAAARAPG